MGYRSNIQVITTPQGFTKMQNIIWNLAKKRKCDKTLVLFPEIGQDPRAIFDIFDVQEDFITFGFDWVKWYESYDDVGLFMNMLTEADVEGVDWQFIRIGEGEGEIEELCSDDFWDNPPAYLRPKITVERD